MRKQINFILITLLLFTLSGCNYFSSSSPYDDDLDVQGNNSSENQGNTSSGNTSSGNTQTPESYIPKKYWGYWTRMDNGYEYYINSQTVKYKDYYWYDLQDGISTRDGSRRRAAWFPP